MASLALFDDVSTRLLFVVAVCAFEKVPLLNMSLLESLKTALETLVNAVPLYVNLEFMQLIEAVPWAKMPAIVLSEIVHDPISKWPESAEIP